MRLLVDSRFAPKFRLIVLDPVSVASDRQDESQDLDLVTKTHEPSMTKNLLRDGQTERPSAFRDGDTCFATRSNPGS